MSFMYAWTSICVLSYMHLFICLFMDLRLCMCCTVVILVYLCVFAYIGNNFMPVVCVLPSIPVSRSAVINVYVCWVEN